MNEKTSASRQNFREAMSRLGAAVNIITTTGPDGDAGFTASAVCSVTDDPPTLLVCVNKNASQHDAILAAGFLCVNVLTHEHQELSPMFAGVGNVPMAERFAQTKWLRLDTGAPVLESATAAFDCKIDQVVEVGTHSVIFCAVRAIHLGDTASGLIYHGRAYHKVNPGKG
ncbi:FMN reductase (NADH) RutF [Acidocella aquatica]|uniref:FMN reductase (NADH) RutF n=1 Tax=Acidocella aquatica TaxID=1922313 RepID=A0ABQ6A2H3_9PROT|nr:flavin reductase [Acidocella aquatica]GLR65608.1 FMN reductase (NADH) RutF [Acidocella aquatica]